MVWLRVNEETYCDVYECSNCHTRIMVDESGLTPCYCEFCGKNAEDDEK